MTTRRITAYALRWRDEKGLHMSLIARDEAQSFVLQSCITNVRRGMMGERFVVLANGLVLVVDKVTTKQLQEWRDF